MNTTPKASIDPMALVPPAAPIANLGPKPTAPDRASDADLASKVGAGAFAYRFDTFIKRLTHWHACAGSSMASEDLFALWAAALPLSHRFHIFLSSVEELLFAGDHAAVLKAFRDTYCYIPSLIAFESVVWKPSQSFREFSLEFKHLAQGVGLSPDNPKASGFLAHCFIRCCPSDWNLEQAFGWDRDCNSFDRLVEIADQCALLAGMTEGPGRLFQPSKALHALHSPYVPDHMTRSNVVKGPCRRQRQRSRRMMYKKASPRT